MKDYKNILVIKMSSLGDIIHALPSLYALRELFPDACITWAIHESFAKILPGKPWIDNVYVIDRKRIKKINYLLQVRKDLHKKQFDLVIDLQMIAKSGLISFLTGCHERIGYNDARECSGLFSRAISGKYKNGHIIEQLLDVIRYLGWQGNGIHFPLHDYKNELSVVRKKLSEANMYFLYPEQEVKIKSGLLNIGESWQNDWPRRGFSVLYPELWVKSLWQMKSAE